MSILRDTYGLVQGAAIHARVQAQNVIGWSAESAANVAIVAQVATVPVQPTQSPTRAATSSHSQLVVNWAALTGADAGGSPITAYALRYDDASFAAGAGVWTPLTLLEIPDPDAPPVLTFTVS